jgi:hypothetical protein
MATDIDLNGSKEVARPAARASKLAALSDAELRAMGAAVVQYCRESFGPELMEKFVEPLLKSQMRRLEERIRAIEERPLLEDCGVWNKNSDYHPGMCVTFDGSMWVAKTWHRNGQPGKCDDWRLMVKRGKDGRDGTGSR